MPVKNYNPKIWLKVERAVKQEIVVQTEEVKNEALHLIFDTPKTGRIYDRGTHLHQASAPGESFANDTGNAVSLIDTRFEKDYLKGIVNFGAEYALALELGTAKMAPRPTAVPALKNREPYIYDGIRKAIAKAVA